MNSGSYSCTSYFQLAEYILNNKIHIRDKFGKEILEHMLLYDSDSNNVSEVRKLITQIDYFVFLECLDNIHNILVVDKNSEIYNSLQYKPY